MSPETNRRINSPEHGANSPTNRYVETQRRKRKRGDGLLVPFRGAAPPFGARCRRCRRDRRRRIFRPALPDRRGAFRPQERRFPDQPAAAGDRTRPRRALRLDQRSDRTFAERQSRSVRRLEPRFPGCQYRHGGAVQPAHENLGRDGSRAGHALRPLGVLAFREARSAKSPPRTASYSGSRPASSRACFSAISSSCRSRSASSSITKPALRSST